MPKNKVQGVIFGILMSITMAYGMEVYNVAWKLGIPTMARGFSNMTNDVFADAFIEASYMWIFVFLFSNLWGTRGGASLAKRLIDPERDSAFVQGTVRSCCTVLVMCPTMSLVASILFNIVLAGMPVSQLPGIWAGTLIKTSPWRCYGTSSRRLPSRVLSLERFSRTWEKQGQQKKPKHKRRMPNQLYLRYTSTRQ